MLISVFYLQFYIYLFVFIYFQYIYYCYTYLIEENFKSSIFQSLDPASHASFRTPKEATNCISNLNTFILDPLFISRLYVAFGLSYSVLIITV